MDSIVAIDLGTSHITGVVGEKKADGKFSIIACETEESNSCIRRGNVYNINETAAHVKNLVSRLEFKMGNGLRIERVYAGIGGQSLHTIEHSESKEFVENAVVTQEDINELDARCERFAPDLSDALYTAAAQYYVDGHREANPVGIPCKHLEARYKIVVGRASIRRNVLNGIGGCVKDGVELVVSPLALSDAVLTSEEKELGCALIDFGAAVTSLSVYKGGDLLQMSVIPLGGGLITRDIASLQLTEAEAEKIKINHGNAFSEKANDGVVKTSNREIKANDINVIVEARAKEIVDNVLARLGEAVDIKALGAGIAIAGGASALKNLQEMVAEKSGLKVRPSIIREGLVSGSDDMLGDPSYMLAISLMLKGTENCVSAPFMNGGDPVQEPEPKPAPEEPKTPKRPRKRLLDKFKDTMGNIFDENYE